MIDGHTNWPMGAVDFGAYLNPARDYQGDSNVHVNKSSYPSEHMHVHYANDREDNCKQHFFHANNSNCLFYPREQCESEECSLYSHS